MIMMPCGSPGRPSMAKYAHWPAGTSGLIRTRASARGRSPISPVMSGSAKPE